MKYVTLLAGLLVSLSSYASKTNFENQGFKQMIKDRIESSLNMNVRTVTLSQPEGPLEFMLYQANSRTRGILTAEVHVETENNMTLNCIAIAHENGGRLLLRNCRIWNTKTNVGIDSIE